MALIDSYFFTDRVTSCVLLSSSVLPTHVSAVLRQIELFVSQYKNQIKILQPRYVLLLKLGLPTSYVDCQISVERYVGLNGENLLFVTE